MLLGQKRKQKQILKMLESHKGNKPIAVIIDLMVGDSEPQVLLHLKNLGLLNIERLKISKEILKKDEIQDFVQDLLKIKGEAMAKGTDKIHLFYRGPVVGAMIAGEVFSNSAVTIYHFNKESGTYESWGPLHRSFL